MSFKEFGERHGKEIPPLLFSETTGKPIESCSACNQPLDDTYRIFKTFSRPSPDEPPIQLFEMALCDGCQSTYGDKISRETKEKIEALQETNPDLAVGTVIDLDVLLNKKKEQEYLCKYSKKPMESLKEYEISAFLAGNKLIGRIDILGEDGIKAYQDCISEETQGYMDDFFNDLIDLPPEIKELLKNKGVILV